MDTHASDDALIEKIRTTAHDGKLIVILGWNNRNHSDETRILDPRRVCFIEKLPPHLPKNTGLVITTPYIKHKDVNRAVVLTKNGEVHRIAKDVGEIRRMLAVSPELIKPVAPKPAPKPHQPLLQVPVPPRSDGVTILTPPAPDMRFKPVDLSFPDTAHTPEEQFAQEFLELAGPDADETLSRVQVKKLVQKHFSGTRTTQDLVKCDLLIGVKSEDQQRVGQYAAGPALLEIHTKPAPADPIEKARWLISHEQDFLAKKTALEAALEEITKSLQRIGEARRLLAELETLVK